MDSTLAEAHGGSYSHDQREPSRYHGAIDVAWEHSEDSFDDISVVFYSPIASSNETLARASLGIVPLALS